MTGVVTQLDFSGLDSSHHATIVHAESTHVCKATLNNGISEKRIDGMSRQ
jgi:hypothetical protein